MAFLLYALTGLVSFIAFALAAHLWRADLSIPFAYVHYGDTIQPQFKMALQNTWLFNPYLAAPFGQNLHAMTELNTLKWAEVWLLDRLTGNVFVAQNLFQMLSPVLSAVTFLYAVRRLGISYAAGIPCAILFGNLYLFYWRVLAGHLMQTNYWMVPLGCLALLQIAGGVKLSLKRDAPIFLAIAVGIGLEDHYEVFFAGSLAVMAVIVGSLQLRTFAPLINACLFVGTMAVSFVINDLPPILWALGHHGERYVYPRNAIEAYLYSLSIGQMVLPNPDHRIPYFAFLRQMYDNVFPPLTTENMAATLGVVGTIGICMLLAAIIARGSWNVPRSIEHAALLTLSAVILATTGGINAIINTYATADIRAYNRISTWVAFFCLFAVAYALDALWKYLRARGWPALYAVLACVLTVLGVLDQSPAHPPPYAESRAAALADREWIDKIAATVPRDGAVLELPYVDDFNAPTTTIQEVPYFWSNRLRWSVGAFAGMPDAHFESWIAALPPRSMIAAALLSGFDGVMVYRAELSDRWKALEAELQAITGNAPVVSADGSRSYFAIDGLLASARAADPTVGTPQGLAKAVALSKQNATAATDGLRRIEAALRGGAFRRS